MSGPRAGATLRRRFVHHVTGAGLLPGGTDVLVAISGGLDSAVLLHLIRFGLPDARVGAAHFDHALRPESGADAAWVRGLCVAWSVPLSHARAAVPARAEAGAREQRYQFLHAAAAEQAAAAIATAHHADDQAETVLFRLTRGTGLKGLAGIPERRGMIVRPLLPFSREELRAYAEAVGLSWRDDSTNVSLRHARNRIRHVVLPELESIHRGAARGIASLAAHVSDSERAWDEVIAGARNDVIETRLPHSITLARDRLLTYDPHVRARVLRHLLAESGSRPGRAGTRDVVRFVTNASSGARVTLDHGVTLEREFDRLIISWRPSGEDVDGDDVVIESAGPGRGLFTADGQRHEVRWGAVADASEALSSAAFDLSSLRFPLTLRTWRPGDRIRLEYGTKKLKKLFQEHHLSRSERRRVPVLSDADDRVLWVAGVTRSVTAVPATGEILMITVMHGDTL